MGPANFIVLLDANVLFPFTLRDTLLRAAAAGFYQVRWTSQILDEALRNLLSTGRMDQERARRLLDVMQQAFPEAEVKGYEPLVEAMQNEDGDRHVAAAAVKAGAQVIVTANLKHFSDLPEGVEAQGPDDFLCNLFDLDGDVLVELLREQAADLQRPPVSFEELLVMLARAAPCFVALVRKHVAPE